MASQSLTQTHQSQPRLPGTWKLGAGRAITLRPAEDGTVRVAHGRIWATYDGPHGHGPDGAGDRIVESGGALLLRAGQRLVLESWSRGQPAYFSWEPAPVSQPSNVPQLAGVRQSLSDLRLALVFGGGALGRLLGGVAALVAARASAPPHARCHATGLSL